MAYTIYKSDGSTSVQVDDNTINTLSSSLSLVGRNATNYGAPIAQNFIRLAENFAYNAPPNANANILGAPHIGQFWYNTSTSDSTGDTGTPILKQVPHVLHSITTDGEGNPEYIWKPIVIDRFPGGGTIGTGTGVNESVVSAYITTLYSSGSIAATSLLSVDYKSNPLPGSAALAIDGNVTYGASSSGNTFTITNNITSVYNAGALITYGAGSIVSNASKTQMNGNWAVGVDSGTIGSIVVNDGSSISVAAGGTINATYADLAERFKSDEPYEFGTVLSIGGANEVTKSTSAYSNDVVGVVAEKPAFILNNEAGDNETHPPIALAGRTRVKVVGTVKKGDRLVQSDIPGVAMSASDLSKVNSMNTLGRAIEDKLSDDNGYVWMFIGAK